MPSGVSFQAASMPIALRSATACRSVSPGAIAPSTGDLQGWRRRAHARCTGPLPWPSSRVAYSRRSFSRDRTEPQLRPEGCVHFASRIERDRRCTRCSGVASHGRLQRLQPGRRLAAERRAGDRGKPPCACGAGTRAGADAVRLASATRSSMTPATSAAAPRCSRHDLHRMELQSAAVGLGEGGEVARVGGFARILHQFARTGREAFVVDGVPAQAQALAPKYSTWAVPQDSTSGRRALRPGNCPCCRRASGMRRR